MLMLTAVIISTIFGITIAETNPIVQTIHGKVRGVSLKTFNDGSFYAFQGIPFAEPPVGALRFQPPRPAQKWNGVLDDQNAYKTCIQKTTDLSPTETEDCLYLNVYTPQLPNKAENVSLPVMVYIHGGAFVRGSGNIAELKPYRLMDYGIIMVAIQYRLGFFGFVSTGDLECPGNNGFKDQQLAIRWVQQNIRNFGGDPTRVTVAGQSAGAASVGYQLLGSNAEGLFRGVIQASGSSLGAWSLQRDQKGHAYQIANHINSSINEDNTNTKDLIRFLKKVDVLSIKKALSEMFGDDSLVEFLNTFKSYVFSGVIEPEHDGAFLTEAAFNKFASGNFNVVPTLIGITSEESLYFVNVPDFKGVVTEYDSSPELVVTPDMHIIDPIIKRSVGEEIRNFYVGDGLLHENMGLSMKLISDAGFGKPNIKQAQLISKYTDVYFYEFAYSGAVGRRGRPEPQIPGADKVGHGEDLTYIYPPEREEFLKYPEQDILTSERYLLLWTNFVKYLNPTPEPSAVLQDVIWSKVTPNTFPYLLINETLEVNYDLKKPMMDEYSRLYHLYAILPLDTY